MMSATIVYGVGISGRGAAEVLARKGQQVFLYNDTECTIPEELAQSLAAVNGGLVCGKENYPALLEKSDRVVLSPGVPCDIPTVIEAEKQGKEVISEVELGYRMYGGHIAAITGTNGKGSTATYTANIFKASGKKVGLYTSPFLVDINEMITINGEAISDDDLSKFIKDYENDFKKYTLSEFEIMTFVALTYFKEQHCDICVIECGMGGELDATNIFTPICSVITSISLEHTSFLGRSTRFSSDLSFAVVSARYAPKSSFLTIVNVCLFPSSM